MKWQIREAKARFTEMVERTVAEGPQTIIRRGEAVAVLVSVDEYRRLQLRWRYLQEIACVGASARPRDSAVARPH
jgi:antitoxin Phd